MGNSWRPFLAADSVKRKMAQVRVGSWQSGPQVAATWGSFGLVLPVRGASSELVPICVHFGTSSFKDPKMMGVPFVVFLKSAKEGTRIETH